MASTTYFFYITAPTGSLDSVAACNKLLEGAYVKNPINFDGPKEGFEVKAVEEGLFVRVDMPGVEDEDLNVSLQNDTVFVKAEARKVWDQETHGRLYCGSIHLLPHFGNKVALLKKDLKNGVLTMVLDACGFCPNFSARTTAQFSNKNFEFPSGWTRISRDYLIKHNQFFPFNPPAKYISYYPFQVGGVNGAYEARIVNSGIVNSSKLYLRVDMPGVEKDGLCHKFSERAVCYGGDSVVSEHNEKRRYFGRFRLSCDCCKITHVKTEVKAGVIRMLISKETFKSFGFAK